MVVTSFQSLDDAPNVAPCNACQTLSPRVWTASRAAIDIRPAGHVLLRVVIGVFRCTHCRSYFRNQPTILRPRSTFTNRVVQVAIASVIEDGMPVTRVMRRMSRDFGIKISEGSLRSWIVRAAAESRDAEYINLKPVLTQETSGVLCLDEAYSGRLAILIATDPNRSDQLVGYLIGEKSFDQTIVKNFLGDLRNLGISPRQVITDESALYPAAIREVWPLAAHQLCLFHVGKKLATLAKKAVQSLRRAVPKPKGVLNRATIEDPSKVKQVLEMKQRGYGMRAIAKALRVSRNSAKKWVSNPDFVRRRYRIESASIQVRELVGREVGLDDLPKIIEHKPVEPSKVPNGWNSWSQVTEARRAMSSLAFSIFSRKKTEKFEKAYEVICGTPIQSQIDEIRSFVTKWHEIWWVSSTSETDRSAASEKWMSLKNVELTENTRIFSKFQQQMTPDLFNSLTKYFGSKEYHSTNNSAERYARRIKKIQKSRYRIRSPKHLEDHILLNELSRRV